MNYLTPVELLKGILISSEDVYITEKTELLNFAKYLKFTS